MGTAQQGLIAGGVGGGGVRQFRLDTEAVDRLGAEDEYVIDLSREGAIYELDPTAGPIDFTRVVVRTDDGEQPIGVWQAKTFGKAASSESFRIGSTSDFQEVWQQVSPQPTRTFGATNYTCAGQYCDCTGALDCGTMILSGDCGKWIRCTKTQCICEIKK